MKSLVSIIIPAWQAEPYLAETLDSALSQTYPPLEIIVVDDASEDDTLKIARGYETRGVRVLAQKKRGASAARNAGLTLARGEFIQFLDADDLLAPDKIERQIELLRQHPGCIASGEWARFHKHPSEANFIPEPNWRDFSNPLEFLVMHYNEGWMMHPAAWLCPRDLVERAGPWNENLSLNDDGEYFCRVMLASSGIRFASGARSYYRSGLPSSLSRQNNVTAFRSLHESIRLNTAAMLAKSNDASVRQAAANAWQQLAYEVYPLLPDLAKEAELHARELGGATRKLMGGRLKRLTAQCFGWRFAKRMEQGKWRL